MSETSLTDVLRETGFLHGIGEEHLERIASVGELVEFAGDEVIFREGEPAVKIFLITSGSVSLEICAPGVGCRRILTVGPGELLGWSPVLEQPRLTATARAIAPTQALCVSASQVLMLCEHNPRFGLEFMQRTAAALAKRLKAARLQLLNIYGAEMTAEEQGGTG